MKKILPFFYEQKFKMHDSLFQQGKQPEYVYVVLDGDIELIREKKPHRVLIDPMEDKIKAAKKLSSNALKTHLEHLSPDRNAFKMQAFQRKHIIDEA